MNENQTPFIITSVQRIRRNRKLFKIELNHSFWIDIHIDILEKYALKQGNEISSPLKQRIESDNCFHLCLVDAVNSLSRRMRTAKELRTYLSGREHSLESIDAVLTYLMKKKLIDDSEYCRVYIQEKSERKLWGPVKIRYELMKKGVELNTINESLQKYFPENLVEEIFKQYFSKQLDRMEREYSTKKLNRLYQACLRAGYPSDLASSAIREMKMSYQE